MGLRPKVKVKQRCWKECREQDGCNSIQCTAFSHKALIRSWVMLMARSCFMSAPLSLSLSQLHFTWREALHRELPLKSTNHQLAILKCWAITYLIKVISDSFSCQSMVSVTSVILDLLKGLYQGSLSSFNWYIGKSSIWLTIVKQTLAVLAV